MEILAICMNETYGIKIAGMGLFAAITTAFHIIEGALPFLEEPRCQKWSVLNL